MKKISKKSIIIINSLKLKHKKFNLCNFTYLFGCKKIAIVNWNDPLILI
jgi:hypothetical protein